MEDIIEPEHSPLGASSAERWMACPGSNVILDKLKLPQSDEQDYRRDGIAAHELANHCLVNTLDTWETIGMTFHEVVVDKEMADAVQVYLDDVRQFMTPDATVYIEQRIGADSTTRPHKDFFGTVDFGAYGTHETIVEDFKYGEGIVVEPEWNAQIMYYAYGILRSRPVVRSDRVVRLRICQPRAYHADGPIREWTTTAGEIMSWGENELLPAMQRAEFDTTLDPGKWCRFCPAKLFCPLLQGLFGAAATADPSLLPNFGQKRIGLEYQQIDAVNFYVKALKDEVYRRNMLGNTVPGTKLVLKKANRIWTPSITVEVDGAEVVKMSEEVLKESLGDAIYTKPELKSPAEVAKISAAAKKLVAELAYMPQNGLTVALDTDDKPAVKVEKAEDIFAHLIEQADTQATNGD